MAGTLIQDIDQRLESILEEQAARIADDLKVWLGHENLADVTIVYDCRQLEKLGASYRGDDAIAFNEHLNKYFAEIAQTPPVGFSSLKQNWESFYNRFSPYYYATICYLLGFLLTVIAWVGVPYWFNRMAWAAIFGGWVMHMTGILMSIVISGRAPVTGLYSSFIFVTAAVVGVFLSIERIKRHGFGIGNLLGSVLGVCGLLWAWNISLGTEDTFAVLVAVLDTNFWLSTHVICVTLGYTATVVAGALGIVFIVCGLCTPFLDYSLRQSLARLIYGTVCFALLFSFVGTVLGGLWADDSWGRFWGWDPKENGALMIVLWNAVVLHARWGGMVRQRGMAALALIGAAVTLWSWEGVNQLGVGLHAYALSDANKFLILAFIWAGLFAIAGLAMIPPRLWWSRIDQGQPPPTPTKGA
jgi:ABC-type transport system involved in cytochrome c biogenesis permease subunit